MGHFCGHFKQDMVIDVSPGNVGAIALGHGERMEWSEVGMNKRRKST